MDDQDFSILSSNQERLMRDMNAYLKAIDITDSPGDSAATMKVTNSQKKTLSSRLKVPPLATITPSSSSSSSSGSGDSTNKDSSTTNDNTEVGKMKKQGRRRSLTNHLNSIDEDNRSNGSKISADCYNHIYNEGQKVIYTNAKGSCLAVITKVHYDDEMQPYYTIEVEGKEKQTDNNHLSRFNESEYEYFNEAHTTTSSSQFEDDSLVAMAKRMDDSQTIVSDPSLICGTKEKALLTLPNLPNITKKLGISKGKQPTQRQPALDSPLPSDDEDNNRSISSDSSSSASVEVFDYNGMTREQVMKRGRKSPIDAPSGHNEEGRRSRGGSRKKNGEKTHRSRRHHRSSTEEKRTTTDKSRHRSSSRSRTKRRDKERKRRRHKHDDDDESMHGIGFNTRVINKSDVDDRKRRPVNNERPPIQKSQPRRSNHTKNQIYHHDDSSDSDEHSTYDSDDCTQIFYESTDDEDEWCSANSEEELVPVGTSVTDAVNNLNKKRGVKSLFGLR